MKRLQKSIDALASTKPMTLGQKTRARLDAQGGPFERAQKACNAAGISELAEEFMNEFDDTAVRHGYNWRTSSDEDIQRLAFNYMQEGSITIRPSYNSGQNYESARDQLLDSFEMNSESIYIRVVEACQNPDVPERYLRDFIKVFNKYLLSNNLKWENLSDEVLTDYIDDFLRNGTI